MATSSSSIEPLQSVVASSFSGSASFSPSGNNASPPPSLLGVEGLPTKLFIKPVELQFICTICNQVLRWAMQEGCGCRACYGCLQRTIKTQTGDITCSKCGESFPREDIVKDNVARKKLERYKVYCANRESGCQQQLLLKNLDEHLLQECEYQMVQCIHNSKGCMMGIPRVKLAQHLQKECMFRRVKCQYCNEDLMASEQELHEKKCKDLMVSCPNNCGTELVHKDNIEEHVSKTCPLSQVDCLFKQYGCDHQAKRKLMDVHMEEAQTNHLQLVTQRVIKMDSLLINMSHRLEVVALGNQTQSLDLTGNLKQLPQKNEKQIRDLQRMIAPRMEQIDTVEDSINKLAKQTTVNDLKDNINLCTDQFSKLENRLRTMEQQHRPTGATNAVTSAQSNPRMTMLMENQMGMHAVRIAEHDLRFQVLETASFDGTLLWKIKDFTRRKRDADNGKTLSLYSQPFYTSRFGYKLCARVYLNGDGMGKGTHVSLFFVVMRGDYDALLPWPFCQKVTLLLIDQDTGIRHLTDSFRPDPASSSFQRPTNEMNIASGCPLFVSQSVLSDSAYVKDNVMFIKVNVDVTDVVRP